MGRLTYGSARRSGRVWKLRLDSATWRDRAGIELSRQAWTSTTGPGKRVGFLPRAAAARRRAERLASCRRV
jgi:hypothetical protein